jgi:GNAT superfamily N-acetyltransferase
MALPEPGHGDDRRVRGSRRPLIRPEATPAGGTLGDDVEIRPITPDQFEAYLVALEVAFSARVEEGDLDRERSVAILKRFLAAWDDRIGGAASLQTDDPARWPDRDHRLHHGRGRAPTHRRRGINTALMRRQLDDLHVRGTSRGALWVSGGIYGRFGYGMASLAAEVRIDADRSRFVRGYQPEGRIELLPATRRGR